MNCVTTDLCMMFLSIVVERATPVVFARGPFYQHILLAQTPAETLAAPLKDNGRLSAASCFEKSNVAQTRVNAGDS